MALETVDIVLDQTWRLISNAGAGRFRAVVKEGIDALFSIGTAAPDAGSLLGTPAKAMNFDALDGKVWARGAGIRAVLSVTRVVDAGNPALIVLPDIGLSATTFSTALAAGGDIATITNRIAGDVIEGISLNDGRLVLSTDKTKLVRGMTDAAPGAIRVEIVTSHPLAANSPKRQTFTIGVTAPALAISGTPEAATVGKFYGFVPSVTGGYGTKSFSLTGSLPEGLSFSSSTGAITGHPRAAGTFNFSVAVSDVTGSANLAGKSILIAGASGGGGGAFAKQAFGQRMVLPTSRFQSQTNITHAAHHMVDISPPWDTISPQMCFVGWYNNEIPIGNDVNVEGAWIEINGVKVDLKVGGSTSFVTPNGGFVWTDEDDTIKVPANSIIRWGWANNAPVGAYRALGGPVNLPIATFSTALGRGDNGFNGGASQLAAAKANTTGNGATSPGSSSWYSPPIAFVAKPDGAAAIAAAKSALVVGDSIGWGLNGYNFFYSVTGAEFGAFGYVNRGLADPSGGRVPRINFCVPGTRYPDLAAASNGETNVNGFAGRAALLAAVGDPCSTILCEMGINTVSNDTAAVTIAKANAAWAYIKGLKSSRKLIQTTMTPQTLSVNDPQSNGGTNYLQWTSDDEAKQLRGADAAHVALDNHIMSKPAPLDGVIDIRPFLESSPGSRKWARPAGQQGTIAATIAPGDLTFQMTGFKPVAGDVIVVDPNDTQNLFDSVVMTAVTGDTAPYTVTVRNASSFQKAHTAGAPVCGAFTNDGTHTSAQSEKAAKQAIIAAKGALA